jgi:hypothetical protein
MAHQKVWSHDTGLALLDNAIGDPHQRIVLESLVAALRANLQEERLFASTPAIRRARAALVRQLNQFALDHLHRSFNDLCISETDQNTQSPSYDLAFIHLRSFLPVGEPGVLLDVLDLEYQLWSTITQELRYGSIERTRRERVEVLAELDRVAQTYSGQRFTDWVPLFKAQSSRTSHLSTRLSSTKPSRRSRRPAATRPPKFDYEAGLAVLEARVRSGESHERLRHLAAALRQNMQEERVEGATEERRNERNHLIEELNDLALKQTGQSYNDWCWIR